MVSLNFGLIRELPSRSVQEDDEEDCGSIEKRTYTVECPQFKYLLISTCSLSQDFGDIYLLPDEPKQCGFLNETLDSNEEQKLNRKIGTAYSLSSEVCILKLSPDLEEGYLNQIAEKIVNLADNVIVLSAKHLTAYFRTEADPTSSHTLARCLKTKNWQDDLKIRSLERPNVVTGIAAAVLTQCLRKDKPGMVFLNFSDNTSLDSFSLQGFARLMDLPALQAVVKTQNVNVKERLAKRGYDTMNNLFL